MASNVYRPRMLAQVFVPELGTASTRKGQANDDNAYRLDVQPIRARLVSNNWNEADELELTCTYDEAGLDPRYLRSAQIAFYLGDETPGQPFSPQPSNLRFVGIARDVTREFSESGGKMVRILAQDYTCLFLESKNYPVSGLPKYTDTLQAAWNAVCDNTGYWDLSTRDLVSTVQVLRSNGKNDKTDALQCI